MMIDAFRSSPSILAVCARNGAIVETSGSWTGTLLEVVAPASRAAVEAALASVPSRVDASIGAAWYQLDLSIAGDRVAVVATEITARKALEERLRRAEGLMIDTAGTAHLGTWEWDIAEPNAVWSAELYRIYGLTPETYTPSYEAYLTLVHPDDRAHVMAATEQVFTKHEPYSHDERIYRPDGSIRYLHTWARAVVDADGKLQRLIGVCQDITDRKLAEAARLEAEAQLRRAQKLEAVGRLTGGIAHDFNNVLGVVIGYASLLYRRAPSGSADRDQLGEIIGAVERASRLTSQLLAFSRDNSIERVALDLDRTIEDLAPLLARMVGERVAVELDLHAGRRGADEDRLVVDANPSQIEQVLMNLGVNARDAMPDGGTLKIATTAAGSRALLVVGDTGVGMSADVQAQIFDPFFTTKPVGKGTGLGLSTVYGIVTQGGGTIAVTSAAGAGTQFEIALPRSAALAEVASGPVSKPLRRGSETILLVEDDEALRDMLMHTLESLGYVVLPACDACAALDHADGHAGSIDVVLTDVVMPRMSGRELVAQLQARRPETRVLFMSGYTADIVLGEGVIEGSVEMIRKPFSSDELGRRLRTMLDPGRG